MLTRLNVLIVSQCRQILNHYIKYLKQIKDMSIIPQLNTNPWTWEGSHGSGCMKGAVGFAFCPHHPEYRELGPLAPSEPFCSRALSLPLDSPCTHLDFY